MMYSHRRRFPCRASALPFLSCRRHALLSWREQRRDSSSSSLRTKSEPEAVIAASEKFDNRLPVPLRGVGR
jgi:hypothetical protein